MKNPLFKPGDRCTFTNRSGNSARSGEKCTVVTVVPPDEHDGGVAYIVEFENGHRISVHEEELMQTH
ncbi:MAG: hypothetical protein HYV13_03160 [Candidatus Doudnabacteria bacterium]|nr:hypothetical protein [Candidatus Doudnabacteria bacterium]